MKSKVSAHILLPVILLMAAVACNSSDYVPAPSEPAPQRKKVEYNITVSRDGQVLADDDASIATKGGVDVSRSIATMDEDTPFGLIGIDQISRSLVLDNAAVHSSGSGYTSWFDNSLWEAPYSTLMLSAYYPYVTGVEYDEESVSYSIPFTASETEAGPLVSKTVEMAIEEMNLVPLEFQHITNDIGFKICDVTPDPDLQGLIHLRKMTATWVASAGVFLNDLERGRGLWHKQGYYRKVVVFEGDARVGVGSAEEKFVGYNDLVDRMRDSHRYYSIPDEIEFARQSVEVVYDVEGFTHNNFYYEPLKDQTAKFMLYGLLEDNVFAYGKQYTFHIGLDLSSVYHEITFAPAVGEWETHIYENNEDF